MKKFAIAVLFLFFPPIVLADVYVSIARFKYEVGYSPGCTPLKPLLRGSSRCTQNPLPGCCTNDDGQAVGWVAMFDLGKSRMTPVVTEYDPSCKPPNTPNTVPGNIHTPDFAEEEGAFFAMTANTGPPGVSGSNCVRPLGVMVGNGTFVNWPEDGGPVLYFTRKDPGANLTATITDGILPAAQTMVAAIAGTTAPDGSCDPPYTGTLLLRNGCPGKCVVPKPGTTAPRGAIGLNERGDKLIVLIVGGAEPECGLKTPDLALLMIAFGGYNAVNFDGGGNTNFVWNGSAKIRVCGTCDEMIESAQIPPNVSNPNGLKLYKPVLEDGALQFCYLNNASRYGLTNFGFRQTNHFTSRE